MPSPSEADRHAILKFARQVVIEAVTLGRLPEHVPAEGIFAERHGVFVTLRSDGRLRSSIGVVEAETPLGDSVAESAVEPETVGARAHDRSTAQNKNPRDVSSRGSEKPSLVES